MYLKPKPAARRTAAVVVLAGLLGTTVAAGAQASPVRFNPNYGADRYGTAVTAEGNPLNTAFLVTGQNFPDGLSAGAVAGLTPTVGGLPASGASFGLDAAAGQLGAASFGNVYLVTKDVVPAEVRSRIVYADNIVVIGSENVIGADVWTWLRQNTRANVYRVAGENREDTAAAVSRAFWATPVGDVGRPARVVVATGQDYPDALTGSAAAAHGDSPLLLAGKDGLSAATAAELQRLRPEQVTVVGGSSKVSDAVLDQIRTLTGLTGGSVDRVSGVDRYATAEAVSASFFAKAQSATLTSGKGFADSLAAGAFAARLDGPLLLSDGTCVRESTNLEIERLTRSYGEAGTANSFGGPDVISDTARKRTNCQPGGTATKTYLDDVKNLDGSARYVSDHATMSETPSGVAHFYPRSAAFDVDPRNSDYKVWALGAGYSRFTTVAGIDDFNTKGFTATVEIYGDEKLLATQVVSKAHPATFDVDVRGVDRLKVVSTSPTATARTSVVGNENYLYLGDAAVS